MAEHSKEALALWTDLCEKDDRTSPEEYPDMALITQDEFCSTLDRFRAEGVEVERREHGNCPKCGSESWGSEDDSQYDSCFECNYREIP